MQDVTVTFTGLKCIEKEQVLSTDKVHRASNMILRWDSQKNVNLNELGPLHVNFTKKIVVDLPVLYLNGITVPYENTS